MKPIPKSFTYATAAESRAEGYLRRKFKAIERAQREAAEAKAAADAANEAEVAGKVKQIKKQA